MRKYIDIIEEAQYLIENVEDQGFWIYENGEVEWTDYTNDVHHADMVPFSWIEGDEEAIVAGTRHGWIRGRFNDYDFLVQIDERTVGSRAINELRRLGKDHNGGRYILELHDRHNEFNTFKDMMIAIARAVEEARGK